MRDIGDRIKENYENRARHYLTRRMPVVLRLDGKAFHTYTRGFDKPFDQRLIDAMVYGAQKAANHIQGFKAAFVQSDEVSFFFTDYDTLRTEAWFDYCKSKMETIAASVMTAAFNRKMGGPIDAHFDARSFNIPKEEVANYFLWRVMDWERNSLAMYCQSKFSHKQLHGKGRQQQHDLLHSIGLNWTTDLTDQQKKGTWIGPDGSVRFDIVPVSSVVSGFIDPLVNCDLVTENNSL